MFISRRNILKASVAAPFIATTARAADKISIRIDPRNSLRKIPRDFMGLGYESSSAAMPGLLSRDNHSYVQLVRNLGQQGVIRVGGNVSDFSTYDADGQAAWQPKATTLTAKNLRQLRSFLDATGWNLIWGLNLGYDKLDNAVEEARAVVEAIGPRLLAMEIGNEPDLFPRSGHRSGPYDYAAWHAEYRRYKAAIRAVLPQVKFAGPDIAISDNVSWVESFGRDERDDVAVLTAHHYIGGQANPATSIELMLQEEKKYQPILARLQAASEQSRIPYRICETASFSGGGREGVSDTFAAALWALDYLFVLASYGCGGVNMETGVNHLGWISHYTPIGDDLKGHYNAAPEYYGLLAFAQAGHGDLIGVVRDPTDINLTAYAVNQAPGQSVLTVINKDFSRDAAMEVKAPFPLKQAHVSRLTGPSMTAKDGITLGGGAVSPNVAWAGGRFERIEISDGAVHLNVPAGSAAIVRLGT